MRVREKLGEADKRVVFDLLEDLRAAWELILNNYARTNGFHTEGGSVRYIDGWMACHNFFKLALDHMVSEAGLTGKAAAEVFLGAGDTFMEAMRVRAAQELLPKRTVPRRSAEEAGDG